jgi:hypothetical protein
MSHKEITCRPILSLALLIVGALGAYAKTPELIFVSDRSGGREIWKVEAAAGAVPRQLTTGANAYYPSWSVRNDIVYQSGSAGHLRLLKADGTLVSLNSVAVPSRVSLQEEYPSWSPDGKMIAYGRRLRQGVSTFYRDIWVRTTAEPATAATDVAVYGSAQGVQIDTLLWTAWSPDGKRIAFTKVVAGSAEIFVADIDTTTPMPTFKSVRQLTTDSAADLAPCWSPDGKSIAFQSRRSGGIDIYRMNSELGEADLPNLIRLTVNSADDRNPAWSPDGTSIAFVSERDGNREIYVMSEDGEQASLVRVTTSGGVDENPAWALNRTLVRVERTSKGNLVRTAAPYGGIPYWGYVTTYEGKIYFTQDGQPREHDCWQAQDVVPAGIYFGKDGLMSWGRRAESTVHPSILIGKPAVNLVDAPVRPWGHSSIWIHRGTSFEYFDPGQNKIVYWTTGCIVFGGIEQLVPFPPPSGSFPTERDFSIEVVDTFPPLVPSDYIVSGTVRRTSGGREIPVPGVVVKVLRGVTEVNRMTTDAGGHFWIPGLQPPGSYTVVPELAGYQFTGVRRSPPLPWLPPEFEHSPHAIQTAGFPPDCYGVDFLAARDVSLRLFGLPLGSVLPNGTVQVDFTIKNTGGAEAAGVTITAATLGTTSLSAGLPDTVGAVAAGSSFTRTMVFPAGAATAGTWSRLQLRLTHTTTGTTEIVPTSTRARITN